MLLNATLSGAIAPVGAAPSGPPVTIDLNTHFKDPTVPGTAVDVSTPEGTIPLALTDSRTPKTVANFLQYINTGEYQGTIFHRLATGFVIQGGGYTPAGTHITQFAPIPSEAGISNTPGTIAMALSTGPNSATSEWFINLSNNSSLLNGTSDGGPFTVFGNVVYGGSAVVSKIAALPVKDASSTNPAWNTLPVLDASGPVAASNMVVTNYSVVPALSYSATSDNSSIVTPAVTGSNLVLNFGSVTGTTQVHVTATDLGGNTTSTSFTVGTGLTTVSVVAGELLRFFDADGTFGRVAISGPGTATVSLSGANLVQSKTVGGVATVNGRAGSVSISTTGTNNSSVLTIFGYRGNGIVNLTSLTTDGPLAIINGNFVDVSGDITTGGAVTRLMLGSVSNGAFSIGAGGGTTNLSLASASNEALTAAGPLGSLTASTFSGSINAPSISTLNVRRSFSANLTVSGNVNRFRAGSITGGMWNVSGNVGAMNTGSISGWTATIGTLNRLSVGATIDSSTLSTSGNIGSVTAANLTNSSVLAGVSGLTLPTTLSGFSAADSIRSLRVAHRFINSNVAAQTLNLASLGRTQTSNGGKPFGVAAHSIQNLSLVANNHRLHLRRVNTQAQVTSALSRAGITPQDLVIRIV